MDFSELIGLSDDLTLQSLVGTPAVRLLRLLQPELTNPTRLRTLITELRSPVELLRDTTSRNQLLDLLPLEEALRLRNILDIPYTSDPYDDLKRARFPRDSIREARLFNFLEVAIPEERDQETHAATTVFKPMHGLFAHQRLAARKIRQRLDIPPYRVLMHMPTGAGKTRTAMNIIADHLRCNEPSLVIWLAYSEELCEQAAEEFEETWRNLGDREVEIHRFWGPYGIEVENARDGFLVSGLSKMYNAAKSSIDFIARLADRASLVVIDEGHQAIAETYSLILGVLAGKRPNTGLLGLSATPGRTWNDPEIDRELAKFFGRQKVALEISGYDNPLDYLIEEGYLAHPNFSSIFHEPGFDLSPQDLRELTEGLDISPKILKQLGEDETRNLRIVQRLEELTRSHRRIIVFSTTVEHAHLLATALRARGLDAGSVTAETSRSQRARLIQRFRTSNPQPMVLCNYGVLTAGFDVPSTSAAVIARPTKSLVLYSQMVGRAIRGPKAGGNKEAEIVTVIDRSLPGFGNLGEAFFNWEDVWND